jgi:hypothetical protein
MPRLLNRQLSGRVRNSNQGVTMFATIRNSAIGAATLGLAAGFSLSAQAAYVVTLQQAGANVVASGTGSINLTDLNLFGQNGSTLAAAIFPSIGVIVTGPAASEALDSYSGYSGPTGFGSFVFTAGDSGSGNIVGINNAGHTLFVPAGYVSGNALSDSSTYDNQTLAGLGATPGTYVWTWGTGANADSFTLDIIAAAAAPEPASLALFGVGLAGLGMVLRTRRG